MRDSDLNLFPEEQKYDAGSGQVYSVGASCRACLGASRGPHGRQALTSMRRLSEPKCNTSSATRPQKAIFDHQLLACEQLATINNAVRMKFSLLQLGALGCSVRSAAAFSNASPFILLSTSE